MTKGKKVTASEYKERLEADATERRQLFKELCAHLAEGLSIECFPSVSDHTLSKMFKDYPQDFDKEELSIALKKGRDWWENIGKHQANGTCMGNSRTWYYNMSNRYGWSDRQQIDSNVKGEVSVNVISYASKKPPQHTQDS